MPVRHRAAAAALFATAALALTACGPDETPAGTAAPAPSAPSAHASAPSAHASAKPTDCPGLAWGHLAIHVDDVNGAMNHVEAHIAILNCSPGLPDGPTWEPTPQAVEYTFSTAAKTKIVYAPDGLRTVTWDTALRHLQSCAAPDRYPTPKGEECLGNFYDVLVDPGKQITELTQLYHV
ncbi:hypothetical protein [Kitasatospora viridis]|uniref:Regulator of septum formation n=1 Tax=Kitasatospora viridis TaxID=281105 RepID=A0A561UGC5_9ACTN|nr:hypothetical protein [Kitasatospora viridis]TWF98410.1 hypothetical protein FHX73_112218 [Kitasatospora viridis]